MATKLSDILNKESTGIMFPFSSSTSSTGVAPVSTTQQVYNTSTDGIMTVQGKQYTGPNAIINYGSKEEGYPRNLKQIEKGMLPQFNQSTLPKAGEGKVEVGTPVAPVTPPVEEEKITEPVVDPCPTGFKLVNGVCQRIQQSGNDGGNNKGMTLAEKGYTKVLDKFSGSFQSGSMNSIKMQQLENKYGADMASAIGLTSQETGFDGANIKELTPEEIKNNNRIGNKMVGGTKGTPVYDKDGNFNNETGTGVYRVVGNVTSIGDAMQDFAILPDAIKTVLDSITRKEKATEIISKKISPELQEYYESLVSTNNESGAAVSSKEADNKTKDTTGDSTITDINITNLSKDFGKLNSSITTQNQIFSEASKELENLQNKFVKNIPKERIAKDKKAKAEKAIAAAQVQRDKLFEKSLEATKDQPLTDNEKNYLDSGNRKALAGESKDDKGNVDNRSGQVSGRENSGFGFKATSANYNKKTNTFDQRFK